MLTPLSCQLLFPVIFIAPPPLLLVGLVNVRCPLVPTCPAVVREALAPRLAVIGVIDDVRRFPSAVVARHLIPLVALAMITAVDVCPAALLAASRTMRCTPTLAPFDVFLFKHLFLSGARAPHHQRWNYRGSYALSLLQ